MTDSQQHPAGTPTPATTDGATRRVALAVVIVAAAIGAGLILSRGRIGPASGGYVDGAPRERPVTLSTGLRVTIPKGYEGRYLGFLNTDRSVEGAYFCPIGTPKMEGLPPPGLAHGNIINLTVQIVPPTFAISTMRDQLQADFKSGVLAAAPQPVTVNGWDGFKIHNAREFQTVLLGPARIYTFISSQEDAASESLINSAAQIITPAEEAHWKSAGLPLKGRIVRENGPQPGKNAAPANAS